MAYVLPGLPYSYEALEPYLDAETMKVHHDKHHQTYVDKLNAALEKAPDFQELKVEALLSDLNALPESIRAAVRNHGGGHANHSLFWTSLTPSAPESPSGLLLESLTQTFGGFDQFKTQFSDVAAAHFGSGWAWLVLDEVSSLKMYSLPNQDSPLSQGHTPLLGLDVWEHAYYLKYQNRRPEYIDAFWHIVNWSEIERRYQEAIA